MPENDAAASYDPFQRARLCNYTNACAVAQAMTETTGRSTTVVTTDDPLQPYRVYFIENCPYGLEHQTQFRLA